MKLNWKEIGMRLLWTVIAAVAGAIGAVEIVDMAVINAALIAGIMAVLTFVTNLARTILGTLDAGSWVERLAWTFIQASAAALIAVPVFNVNGIKAAVMVGLIASANVLTLVGRGFADVDPVK